MNLSSSTNPIPSQRITHFDESQLPGLNQELDAIDSECWVAHVNKSVYSGDWSVLPLRTLLVHEHAHPILQSYSIEQGTDWVNLPFFRQLTSIYQLIKQLNLNYKAIRLMKLEAQSQIAEHRDKGLNIENGEARLHLVLQSHDDLVFSSNGKVLDMRPLDLWYVNADQPHSVANNGEFPRINLVIDCIVDDKFKELLHSSETEIRPEIN